MGNSKDATTVLFANVLKLVKTQTSVFTKLMCELEFQRQFGASGSVNFLVDTLKLHCTCHRAVLQIVESLDLARHYGVLQDLMAQRPRVQDPSFAAV